MKFNESESKVMLISRGKRKEKKEIQIYVNNKTLKQVNSIRYLGIIFDSKLIFREHVTYIEEKCAKLIFSLAKSAKISWGLKHKALKALYTGAILPLIPYGAPVWKAVLSRSCYKDKLVRIEINKHQDSQTLPHRFERSTMYNYRFNANKHQNRRGNQILRIY